jgi:hypothetical protein
MKHLIAVVAFFTLLSIAAFGVLIAADRELGVALPYSIPLAFAVPAALAPAFAALAHAMRRRRPIVMQMAPPRPAPTASPTPRPRAAAVARGGHQAQGVVLLDLSTVKALKERVA